MSTSTYATEQLERLAVDIDARLAFDADAAVWLTEYAQPLAQTAALVNIMNDASEPPAVRSRAMAMLTAELLRR